ncbi:MAG TPA: hypothetical protein VK174_17465 [Chitinophagales bacterium]|nr:hypothetical protein [Chitinophagales bacterium]
MKENSLLKSIREYENMHIALWLVKDSCWVASASYPWLRVPGMIMIVPTLLVAIFITWRARNDQADVFHNIAVCLWICANATWMIGEFFYDDTTRPIAMAFFAAGLIVVAVYYVVYFPKRIKEEPQDSN